MNVLVSGRFWLAGPVAFLISIVVMLGMAVWYPEGRAKVDNIILPMIIFPMIWAATFFYAYLDRSLLRVSAVFLGLGLGHIALLAVHFSGVKAV